MIDREKLWEGDHDYFREVVTAYQRIVKAICISFGESEDDVMDLVQGVWTLVYQKRRTFRGDGSFAGWLLRVTNNHCTDMLRGRKAERTGMETFVARGGLADLHRKIQNPERQLERKEAEMVLWNALADLPEKERDSITLRLLQLWSPSEVAEEMGIGKSSVRSNISRGVKRLRDIIVGGET